MNEHINLKQMGNVMDALDKGFPRRVMRLKMHEMALLGLKFTVMDMGGPE